MRVYLRVTPRARRAGIDGLKDDPDGVRFKVAVTAAAEDGKANAAVLALLAREWHLAKSDLAIIAGAGSRNKTIRIAGEGPDVLAALIHWSTARGLLGGLQDKRDG